MNTLLLDFSGFEDFFLHYCTDIYWISLPGMDFLENFINLEIFAKCLNCIKMTLCFLMEHNLKTF